MFGARSGSATSVVSSLDVGSAAYHFFSTAFRVEVRQRLGGWSALVSDVDAELKRMWLALSDEERQEYNTRRLAANLAENERMPSDGMAAPAAAEEVEAVASAVIDNTSLSSSSSCSSVLPEYSALAPKAKTTALFNAYVQQMRDGCRYHSSMPACASQDCVGNEKFRALGGKQLAVKALEFVRAHALQSRMCPRIAQKFRIPQHFIAPDAAPPVASASFPSISASGYRMRNMKTLSESPNAALPLVHLAEIPDMLGCVSVFLHKREIVPVSTCCRSLRDLSWRLQFIDGSQHEVVFENFVRFADRFGGQRSALKSSDAVSIRASFWQLRIRRFFVTSVNLLMRLRREFVHFSSISTLKFGSNEASLNAALLPPALTSLSCCWLTNVSALPQTLRVMEDILLLETIPAVTLPSQLRVLRFTDTLRLDDALSHLHQLTDLHLGAAGVRRSTVSGISAFIDMPFTPLPTVFPHSLRKLALSSEFDSPLRPGDLPAHVEELQFGRSFNQLIEVGTLPASLRKLTLANCFNRPLKAGVLPNGITELTCGNPHQQSTWNQPIEMNALPHTLQTLKLSTFFNSSIAFGALPKGLLSLDLGESFDQALLPGFFPPSLQSLSLGDSFRQALDAGVLPSSLRTLSLGRTNFDECRQFHLPALTCLRVYSSLDAELLKHWLRSPSCALQTSAKLDVLMHSGGHGWEYSGEHSEWHCADMRAQWPHVRVETYD